MIAAAAPSWMLLMMLFGGGGSFLGLPPGERDAQFLNCAPAESIVYLEWSTRGEGTPGAKGIEGLAADPEVRGFFTDVRTGLLDLLTFEADRTNNEENRLIAANLPPLIDYGIAHSGCVYVSLDANAARDAAEEPGPFPPFVAGVRATVILNLGKDAEAFEKHLRVMLEGVAGLEVPVAGLKNWKIDLPLPGLELTLHREGTYFILGFGKGTVDRAVAGIKGEVEGLGKSDRFQAAFKHTALEKVGAVAWLNLQQARDDAAKAIGAEAMMALEMMKMVGADKLTGVLSTSGFDKGDFATKSFAETGGSLDGIFALASGRALKPADFLHVPKDADFVVSTTLNVDQVVTALRATLTNVDPNLAANLDAILQQLQTDFGFSLDKEFPAAFGQQWTLFNAPSTGGYFVTAPMITLEVKDAEKAKAIFDKLMSLHGKLLPGVQENQYSVRGIVLEKKEFLDHEIHFVNTIGDDVPIAPAYCFTKSHVLVALHPQTIKAYLRWKQNSGESKGFGDVFASHAPADGDVIFYQYFDTKKLMQYAYGFLPYFSQIAASELQRSHFDIDIFSLPSAQALVPYLGDSYNVIVRTKDGLLSSGTSIVPGSSMVVPMLFFGVMPRGSLPPAIMEDAKEAPAEF